jgi:endonuclease-3
VQTVDLRGEHEVALREAVDHVGEDPDAEPPPGDVQVGVVRLLVCERADPVGEGERSGEVAEAELLLEVMLALDAPASAEPSEQVGQRRAAQGLRAAATGNAAPCRQIVAARRQVRLLVRAARADYARADVKRAEKARRIRRILDDLYPEVKIPLDHRDPYTLLVAVLLSAQCTDVKVNQITPLLFARAATPQAMVQIPVSEIRRIIRPCGLSPAKAKAIAGLSRLLIERHGGRVPDDFEALEALPGVGHKTASAVMAQAFGRPAFPVDTHIHRLAARWGLSSGRSVEQTERDLKKLFPPETWGRLHLQIIYFGRQHCPARGHDLSTCRICSWASSSARKALERQRAKGTRRAPKARAGGKRRQSSR